MEQDRREPEIQPLTLSALAPFLSPELLERVFVFPELPSTSDMAKDLARKGCVHGTTVVADRQTAGRGQHARSFYSPPGGLYLSMVLRVPPLPTFQVPWITAAAAVPVCRAIEMTVGVIPRVKWVNDILLNGKKAGGILTETIAKPGEGVRFAVLGIGLNVTTTHFPPDIADIAGSLAPGGDPALRVRLCAALIRAFAAENSLALTPEILEAYKRRLISTKED